MPTPDEMRTLVDRYVQAMNSNDREGYVSLFAEDATMEDPVGSEVRRGHDGVRAFWDEVHALSPTITLVLTGPVRVAGSELAFPMEAVSDVGDTTMIVDIIDVFRVDGGGRIASMRAFWDPAEIRPHEEE
jgi:steroid Delta-isomerase